MNKIVALLTFRNLHSKFRARIRGENFIILSVGFIRMRGD